MKTVTNGLSIVSLFLFPSSGPSTQFSSFPPLFMSGVTYWETIVLTATDVNDMGYKCHSLYELYIHGLANRQQVLKLSRRKSHLRIYVACCDADVECIQQCVLQVVVDAGQMMQCFQCVLHLRFIQW